MRFAYLLHEGRVISHGTEEDLMQMAFALATGLADTINQELSPDVIQVYPEDDDNASLEIMKGEEVVEVEIQGDRIRVGDYTSAGLSTHHHWPRTDVPLKDKVMHVTDRDVIRTVIELVAKALAGDRPDPNIG